MAVRFDADGENYTHALALGAQTDYTVVCWFKISVDRNTWSTLWSLDNGTGDVDVLQTSDDGITLGLYSDGGPIVVVATTVDTWYFAAVARAGTSGTAYHRTAAATALTTVNLAGSSATTNMANLRIGESPFETEWLNGCIAGLKFWNVALTQAEIELESQHHLPTRWANLQAFYPFVRAETVDYSGNGRTLTGGTGAVTEDGPPVPWSLTKSSRLVLPATVIGSGVGTPFTVRQTSSTLRGGDVLRGQSTGVPVSGVCALGAVAGSGTTTKIVTLIGGDALGLTSVGSASKLTAERGTATLGSTASGAAGKRGSVIGAVTTGLTQLYSGISSRVAVGINTLGVGATGLLRKITSERGFATTGLAATHSGLAPRVQGGNVGFGLTSVGSTRKTGSGSGIVVLGQTTFGVERKMTANGGIVGLGETATGLNRHLGRSVGVAKLGLVAVGTARKLSSTTGIDVIGTTSSSHTSRVALTRGIGALGLIAERQLGNVLPTERMRVAGRESTRSVAGRESSHRTVGSEPDHRVAGREPVS